jgi:hypothetical protein
MAGAALCADLGTSIGPRRTRGAGRRQAEAVDRPGSRIQSSGLFAALPPNAMLTADAPAQTFTLNPA